MDKIEGHQQQPNQNNGSLKKHTFKLASPWFLIRDNRGSDETLLPSFFICPTWWRAVGWTGGWREPGRPSPTPASTGLRGHSSLRGSAGTSREPSWLWSGPSWKPAARRKETRVSTEQNDAAPSLCLWRKLLWKKAIWQFTDFRGHPLQSCFGFWREFFWANIY